MNKKIHSFNYLVKVLARNPSSLVLGFLAKTLRHSAIRGTPATALASETDSPELTYSGSGGCLTNWTCSSWSSCINGTQNRNCTKGRLYCYADIKKKPVEIKNCSDSDLEDNNPVDAYNISKDKIGHGLESIKNNNYLILIVILVLIIGIILFFILHKRHRKRRYYFLSY